MCFNSVYINNICCFLEHKLDIQPSNINYSSSKLPLMTIWMPDKEKQTFFSPLFIGIQVTADWLRSNCRQVRSAKGIYWSALNNRRKMHRKPLLELTLNMETIMSPRESLLDWEIGCSCRETCCERQKIEMEYFYLQLSSENNKSKFWVFFAICWQIFLNFMLSNAIESLNVTYGNMKVELWLLFRQSMSTRAKLTKRWYWKSPVCPDV